MPRYFFQIEDGKYIPDTDGTVLPDIHQARVEAVRLSGLLVTDTAEQFWNNGQNWQLQVTDEANFVIFTLRFSATEPSAPVQYQPPS